MIRSSLSRSNTHRANGTYEFFEYTLHRPISDSLVNYSLVHHSAGWLIIYELTPSLSGQLQPSAYQLYPMDTFTEFSVPCVSCKLLAEGYWLSFTAYRSWCKRISIIESKIALWIRDTGLPVWGSYHEAPTMSSRSSIRREGCFLKSGASLFSEEYRLGSIQWIEVDSIQLPDYSQMHVWKQVSVWELQRRGSATWEMWVYFWFMHMPGFHLLSPPIGVYRQQLSRRITCAAFLLSSGQLEPF